VSQPTEDLPRLSIPLDLNAEAMPGVLLVFSGNEPRLEPLVLHDGTCEIGRGERTGLKLDATVSREHARVEYDGTHWVVRDLSSRNGPTSMELASTRFGANRSRA
jgi:pSer/pThr/pTyr-binding forkhead associated (FHA) protein